MAWALSQSPLPAPSHGEEVPSVVTPARAAGPDTEVADGEPASALLGDGTVSTMPPGTAFDV
eukprot:4122747-Alexandrium_andersonii.AAC.1